MHGNTLYKFEYCREVIEMGREGKSESQMAAQFGVSKQRMLAWSNNPSNVEFKEALELANTYAQAYCEEVGMKGIKGILPKFNNTAWQFMMKNRYRKDYKEMVTKEMDLTNSIDKLSDEELDKLLFVLEAKKAGKSLELNKTVQ